MRIGLLGPLVLETDGGVLEVTARKEGIVLAWLALHCGHAVSTRELIDVLWDEAPPRSARKAVQTYVHNLRRLLPGGCIETVPGGYALCVEGDDVDVVRFERLVAEGRACLRDGQTDAAAKALRQGLALWRGATLTPLGDTNAASGAAVRLQELRRVAVEDLFDARALQGDHEALVPDLQAAVAAEPLRERHWSQLMLALARSGRRAEALRAYQRCRRLLGDELGLEPSAELAALDEAILLGKVDATCVGGAGEPHAWASSLVATNVVGSGPLVRRSGTVTFLFSDIEGSTRLWDQVPDEMTTLLARHDVLLQTAIGEHDGVVFSHGGDGVGAAFRSAGDALRSAVDIQRSIAMEPWPRELTVRVRVGLHTGEAEERDGNYFGAAVSRAARLASAAHGGQTLVTAAVASLVGDEQWALIDLGDYRLDGFERPERIWQLVSPGQDEHFPPLNLTNGTRTNIPTQRTSFVGRDDDVRALLATLEASGVVTVTGAGGIGKTRLAIEVAAASRLRFPDGAWLAELAPVDTPDAVADVVLTAVGGRRQPARSALSALAELAGRRRMMVILDNCEHVLDAASVCAEAITAGGANVVLATSREPLSVRGEQVVPVASLTADAAASLFAERARAVEPSFMLNDDNRLEVADVCQRLDGIPLAIELAANRVRSMTVPEIREHLRSRFRLLRSDPHAGTKRHRTLQAAVQWSYDLLDARHQRIFRQLSIFAGGFTVDAVVAVCDDCTMDAVDALDALDALVARSVVIADRTGATTRYSLLETLGQFGQDTLAAEGETVGCRARHARHFLGVAEAARHQLSTPDAAAAMTTFEEEWSNLRIAFEWFATNGDVDAALRIVVACYWFAGLSHRYELLSWSERAIALATADQHELWPAAAGVTALLRWGTGDTPGANAITEVASRVETANALRPRFEPALAHAIACVRSEHPERGIELARAAERIAASGADPIELAIARSWLLAAHVVAGRDDLADLADLAVTDAEVTRNPHQLAFAYLGQVAVAAVNHDKPAATEAYSLALRWAEVANNRRVIDNAPLWLATAMTDAPLEALRLVRGVLASFYDAGFWPILPFALEVTFESLSRLDQFHAAALALGGITDNPNTFQRSALEVLGRDLDRLLHQGQTCTRSELVEELLDAIDDCLQGRDPPETEAGHLRKTDRRRTTALR